MNDLISRKALYETMNSQDEEFSLIDALATIEEFPTAYDVDKVMEKLKILSYTNDGGFEYEDVDVVTLSDAIDIVKRGGKDE